jgi:hypothetical protein
MTDEAWIDTVRLVRDTGSVRELLPAGFKDLRDLPYTLFEAIRMALMFLGFEELPDEERPPKRIWLNAKLLKEHFEAVKRARKAAYSGSGDSSREIEDPVENEAAKGLIVG